MDRFTVFVLLGVILNSNLASSLWSCSQDGDCSSLQGSTCDNGVCVCGPGQQSVLGGTVCVDIAPYHTSPCFEDHQCSRQFTGFECRRSSNSGEAGTCFCQSDHHYYRGRCWRSVPPGAPCIRSEECMTATLDPFSAVCEGVCRCAPGYFERQKDECRYRATAVGEGCVLDQDCQFPGGACDPSTFTCIENNNRNAKTNTSYASNNQFKMADKMADTFKMESSKMANIECSATNPCASPFECTFGICVCPIGYYASEDGAICLAHLGSPASENQCVGLFTEVRDGVCSCRPNFFYNEDMKQCVKATRRITDSCVSDSNCRTFGVAARCSQPLPPWGMRSCECVPEISVWDAGNNLCRYFAGIGESCQIDSDCLAGELEIQCVKDDDGIGFCRCPEGLLEVNGLCLTSGLELGDPCQDTLECGGTANSVCSGSVCACDDGYQPSDGICAPTIGGSCELDADCVIENTSCTNGTAGLTCQCVEDFVDYNDVCWPVAAGFNESCTVSAQCTVALGSMSSCVEQRCVCADDAHYRDNGCWQRTAQCTAALGSMRSFVEQRCVCADDALYRDNGCWQRTDLFEQCSRSSECYLSEDSSRTVCRNSLCQCNFDYPYSEQLQTCLSSATSIGTSVFVFSAAFLISLLR